MPHDGTSGKRQIGWYELRKQKKNNNERFLHSVLVVLYFLDSEAIQQFKREYPVILYIIYAEMLSLMKLEISIKSFWLSHCVQNHPSLTYASPQARSTSDLNLHWYWKRWYFVSL